VFTIADVGEEGGADAAADSDAATVASSPQAMTLAINGRSRASARRRVAAIRDGTGRASM